MSDKKDMFDSEYKYDENNLKEANEQEINKYADNYVKVKQVPQTQSNNQHNNSNYNYTPDIFKMMDKTKKNQISVRFNQAKFKDIDKDSHNSYEHFND